MEHMARAAANRTTAGVVHQSPARKRGVVHSSKHCRPQTIDGRALMSIIKLLKYVLDKVEED